MTGDPQVWVRVRRAGLGYRRGTLIAVPYSRAVRLAEQRLVEFPEWTRV